MEENKIDPYQILGFVLLMTAFVWYIYTIPEPQQGNIEKNKENLEISIQSDNSCLLYTSPSPRDGLLSRMPSSA